MTRQKLLEKAIKIANSKQSLFVFSLTGDLDRPQAAYELIFDKHFAQALWGSDRNAFGLGGRTNIGTPDEAEWSHQIKDKTYKCHLAFMAMADDPIEYLGEHLPHE